MILYYHHTISFYLMIIKNLKKQDIDAGELIFNVHRDDLVTFSMAFKV